MFYNIIKHDPDPDFLVFKHPVEDFNKYTQLIVQKGQWAIVYNNGVPTFYTEPDENKYTLKSNNKFYSKWIKKIFTSGEAENHCKVYFINVGKSFSNIEWQVPITIQDTAAEMYFHFIVSGYFSVDINPQKEDIELLLELVPENSERAYYSRRDIQKYFNDITKGDIRKMISVSMVNEEKSFGEINTYLDEIALNACLKMRGKFNERGLILRAFEVTAIDIDERDAERFKKHCDILEEKFSQKALGYDYYTKRVLDALNNQASNTASAPLANVAAGMGMGFAGANLYSSLESNLFENTPIMDEHQRKENNAGKVVPHKIYLKKDTNGICSNCHNSISDKAWTHCPFCGQKI